MSTIVRAGIATIRRSLSAPVVRTTLIVVLAIDAVLIVMHCGLVLHQRGLLGVDTNTWPMWAGRFDLSRDWGIGEYAEYAKAAAAAVFLAAAFVFSRRPIYLVFAAIFAYTGIDNAFRLHEQAAGPASGDVQVGELAYFGVAAIAIIAVIAFAWPRGATAHKVHAQVMLVVVLVYGAFAVGVDAVHFFVAYHVAYTDAVLGLLEDGGELVTLSIAVAVSLAVARACANDVGVDDREATVQRAQHRPHDAGRPASARR